MPSLKAIRKRIASTKATQKITRAMKMVAGARLTRAQQRIVAMRPYAVKTGEVLAVGRAHDERRGRVAGRAGCIRCSRCGRRRRRSSWSSRRTAVSAAPSTRTSTRPPSARGGRRRRQGSSVVFVDARPQGPRVPRRAAAATVAQDFPRIYDGLDLEKARLVARWLVPRFQKGEFDAVYLVFNEFKSAITQKVVVDRLLPLGDGDGAAAQERASANAPSDFLYEPNQRALLERLVPMYVEISIYRALLESQASFFGAQMTAMDAATRNAKEMIARLTLDYNRARQAAITKELMEIIGGAEALKE